MMASLSAMSPSTMRWMMPLCSSSERFLWDTSGVLNLVAGDGSTPWSHAWLSISSSDARLFGSLWSIRFIRLWRAEREDEDAHQKFLEHEHVSLILDTVQVLTQDCVILCWKPRISSGLVQIFIWGKMPLLSYHVSMVKFLSLARHLTCFFTQSK